MPFCEHTAIYFRTLKSRLCKMFRQPPSAGFVREIYETRPFESAPKTVKHSNIGAAKQPNTFKHSNIVVLSTKTENRKRRARRQTKRTMSTSERANNWRRRNKWLKTVMIIDALYVLIMCQMDLYI